MRDNTLRIYYNNYSFDKCAFGTFWQRVHKYKYELEIAIQPVQIKRSRGKINSDGRECNHCKEFKTWDHFNTDNAVKTGKMSICQECSILKHKLYRNTPTGKIKTKNYRIIYRADNEKLANERKKNKIWREEHKAQYKEWMHEYRQKNKEKIKKYRKERENDIYALGETLLLGEKKVRVLAVRKGLGCLCKIDEMKIWIGKYRLKPKPKKYKYKISNYLTA